MDDPQTARLFMVKWAKKFGQLPMFQNVIDDSGQFQCSVSVAGFDFNATAVSSLKLESENAACVAFVRLLLKHEMVSLEELQSVNKCQSSSSDSDVPAVDEIELSKLTISNRQSNGNLSEDEESPLYFLSKEELLLNDAELHGGWHALNSSRRFDLFVRKYDVDLEAQTSNVGTFENPQFNSKIVLYLPALHRDIVGEASANNKDAARTICEALIIRQLYHIGLMESSDSASLDWSNVSFIGDPLVSIFIPSDMHEEIDMFLNEAEKREHWPFPPSRPVHRKYIVSQFIECNVGVDRAPPDYLPLAERYNSELPIYRYRDEILKAIDTHSVTLITGETGCGKSTQVCQYVYDRHLQFNKDRPFMVIVLQTRRIATVSLATQVAKERGENVGLTVGYSIRYEKVLPKRKQGIVFQTTSSFLNKLISKIYNVTHILVDEIHENDADIHVLFILLRKFCQANSKVKVVLMSATMNVEKVERYFGNVAKVLTTGRSHLVETKFLEHVVQLLNFDPDVYIDHECAKGPALINQIEIEKNGENETEQDRFLSRAKDLMTKLDVDLVACCLISQLVVHHIKNGPHGTVLVFLSGWHVIINYKDLLSKMLEYDDWKFEIIPLHSRIPISEQRRIHEELPRKTIRIILSTNIAETSLTIRDVVVVIDFCKVNNVHNDIFTGIEWHNIVYASKFNLRQRRGRAGRCQPGICYHLCDTETYESLDLEPTSKLVSKPLDGFFLLTKMLGIKDPVEFFTEAIEPPPIGNIVHAKMMLQKFGAINAYGDLTPLGYLMGKMSVSPEMAKMVVVGSFFGYAELVCAMVACMEYYPLFIPNRDRRINIFRYSVFGAGLKSDHAVILSIFKRWLETSDCDKPYFCEQYFLDNCTLVTCAKLATELQTTLVHSNFFSSINQRSFYDCSVERDFHIIASIMCYDRFPNFGYSTECTNVTLPLGIQGFYDIKSFANVSSRRTTYPELYFFSNMRHTNRGIMCSNVSAVTPLQMLLFGSRSMETNEDYVIIDNWLKFAIAEESVLRLWAAREHFDNLVTRSIDTYGRVAPLKREGHQLCGILHLLSSTSYPI